MRSQVVKISVLVTSLFAFGACSKFTPSDQVSGEAKIASQTGADPAPTPSPAPVVAPNPPATPAPSPTPSPDPTQESTAIPVAGLKLLFKSGFEMPVTLTHVANGQASQLHGMDSGFSWDSLDHIFNYVAVNSIGLNLVTTRLSTAQAAGGLQSLYISQNKIQSGSQNRLQFFGNDAVFGTEIFTRRKLYFPASINNVLKQNFESTSIGGTREERAGGLDFSLPLYISKENGKFVWIQAGVDYSHGTVWSQWTASPFGFVVRNTTLPVPIEKWFTLDIYVKRHPTQGEVRVWVNGQIIFDLKNVRTKNDTDKWFTKLADVDAETVSGQLPAPFETYADDVEIWSR